MTFYSDFCQIYERYPHPDLVTADGRSVAEAPGQDG